MRIRHGEAERDAAHESRRKSRRLEHLQVREVFADDATDQISIPVLRAVPTTTHSSRVTPRAFHALQSIY